MEITLTLVTQLLISTYHAASQAFLESSPHQLLVSLASWDAQRLHLGLAKTLSCLQKLGNSQGFFELKAEGTFLLSSSLCFICDNGGQTQLSMLG